MKALGERGHVIVLGDQVVHASMLTEDGVVFALRHLIMDQPSLKDSKRMTRTIQGFRGYDLERTLVARESEAQASKRVPQLDRALEIERWVYRENSIESISAAHWSVRGLGELQQANNKGLIRLASALIEDRATTSPAIQPSIATAPATTESADESEGRNCAVFDETRMDGANLDGAILQGPGGGELPPWWSSRNPVFTGAPSGYTAVKILTGTVLAKPI